VHEFLDHRPRYNDPIEETMDQLYFADEYQVIDRRRIRNNDHRPVLGRILSRVSMSDFKSSGV
jgi:hypothetical protein